MMTPSERISVGQLRIEIESETAGAALLEDLLRWLGGQNALRGRVSALAGAAGRGSMSGSGLTEALTVAVGTGGAVTALAQALVVWAKQPRGTRVRIRIVGSDGARTEVDIDRLADAEAVIRAAVQAHGGSAAPSGAQAGTGARGADAEGGVA